LRRKSAEITVTAQAPANDPAKPAAAAGNMASRGVLVRRLDALETLAHIDEVYFDKTGTLTEGMLTLKAVTTADAAEVALAPGGMDWRGCWPQAADLAAQSITDCP